MSETAKIGRLVLAASAALVMTLVASTVSAQSGYNRRKVAPVPPSGGPSTTGSSTGANDPGSTGSSSADGAVKLNTAVVNISAVVTDRAGKYVPTLGKDDFELSEDGAVQQIAFFGSENAPFNVALLLDVSPSVSNSLRDIKKAAIQFVQQLRPEDRVMIVAFDQQVLYLTGFTNNRERLVSAINSCQTGNGTSVYQAVYDTVSTHFQGVQGRKALLLLSDGEDTTSKSVSYDEAIAKVAKSDVLVYGLRYPDTGGQRPVWGHRGGHFPGQGPFPGGGYPRGPVTDDDWPWVRFNLSGSQDKALAHDGVQAQESADNFEAPTGAMAAQWPQQRRGGGYGRRRRDDGRDFMKDVTQAGGGPVYDAKSIDDLGKLAGQIAEELRHVYVIGYYPTKPLSDGGYRAVEVRVKNRDDLSVRARRGYDASHATTEASN